MNDKKFYDASNTYFTNLSTQATLSANRAVKFPDAAGTLSLVDGTETLTNKTLTSPVVTTPVIDGVSYSARNDKQLIIEEATLNGTALYAATPKVATLWTAPADAIVLRVIAVITTESTGASTLDIGYTAVSATTGADTFLDGISGASKALFDSMDATLDSGANAKAQKAVSAKWITVENKTGDSSALVGKVYIHYILI